MLSLQPGELTFQVPGHSRRESKSKIERICDLLIEPETSGLVARRFAVPLQGDCTDVPKPRPSSSLVTVEWLFHDRPAQLVFSAGTPQGIRRILCTSSDQMRHKERFAKTHFPAVVKRNWRRNG